MAFHAERPVTFQRFDKQETNAIDKYLAYRMENRHGVTDTQGRVSKP